MLVWPEREVFVDSRNDFYGETFLRDFDTADEVQAGWEGSLEKHGVGWTILPRKHPLNRVLALHPQWRLGYEDDVTQVFVRQATGARPGQSGTS
jgi:hypothetical protein